MLKGEIYYADLSGTVGSEQGGFRPVVIVQNKMGNKKSPTTLIAPLTTRMTKHKIPTHVYCDADCLAAPSIILCEQIRTIDKSRLSKKVGKLNEQDIERVNKAIRISFEV